MRRIPLDKALYAFDGTGNNDMVDDAFDSNVVEFFNAYIDPEKNQDPDAPRGSLYFKGIGTRARTRFGRRLSEAIGLGGHDRVDQALKRLQNNVDAGDTTIEALDERRLLFPLTRLGSAGNPAGSRLVEVWFRGVHSDVGGGNGNAGLNWISLNWMFENARREELPLHPAAIAANLVHRAAAQRISDHKVEIGPAREILAMDPPRLALGVP